LWPPVLADSFRPGSFPVIVAGMSDMAQRSGTGMSRPHMLAAAAGARLGGDSVRAAAGRC
jgi:hypothetical protein